jgi:hypothetical protein
MQAGDDGGLRYRFGVMADRFVVSGDPGGFVLNEIMLAQDLSFPMDLDACQQLYRQHRNAITTFKANSVE